MKQKFKDIAFNGNRKALLLHSKSITRKYAAMGYRMTLRQLYYQMVSKNIIPNKEKWYKLLGNVVSDGRLAGEIDWAVIEDRNREPHIPQQWSNIHGAVEWLTKRYRRPRWLGQLYYAELWVEKAALASVLAPLAHKYHVTLMVNRGYSSTSAMYESAQRFMYKANLPSYHKFKESAKTKRPILFYLGDFDPSGEDMVRDIEERMELFGVLGLSVQKLALTFEQVKHYQPPPNPVKKTDSRAKKFMEKYGIENSWEVDSLEPPIIDGLVKGAFDGILDKEKMNAIKVKEKGEREQLHELVQSIAKE